MPAILIPLGVMAGLDPAIPMKRRQIPGSSPGMTIVVAGFQG
jgi:hypothetical protein